MRSHSRTLVVYSTWEMLSVLVEMHILYQTVFCNMLQSESNQSIMNTESSLQLMAEVCFSVNLLNTHSVYASLWGFVDQVSNKEIVDKLKGWVNSQAAASSVFSLRSAAS